MSRPASSGDFRFHAPAPEELRERIEANLASVSAQRMRELFAEINPHIPDEQLYAFRRKAPRKSAAVLIPIIARPEPTVLLTVRSSDMPSHAGEIAFPGGKVQDDDADRVATALREAEEEVSIPRDAVDVIGSLGVHHGGRGFSVTPVIGIVSPDAPIAPCPREVAEIFEAPLSFVADLDNHVTEQHELKGVTYNMFAAPFEGYRIWGLTAGILRSFAETLQHQDLDAALSGQ